MKQGLGVPGRQAPGDAGDGVDVPQLIVHQHTGHQRRIRPDGGEHLLRGDGAVLGRGQVGDFVPLPLHPPAAFQHRAVLHGGGDDVFPDMAVLPAGGGDGPVVRLRAAGGEEQLPGITVQGAGDGAAPGLHPALHLQPQGILGAGIAELLRQHLIHSVRHRPGHGGGGGVVQIDHERISPYSWALPNDENYSIIKARLNII